MGVYPFLCKFGFTHLKIRHGLLPAFVKLGIGSIKNSPWAFTRFRKFGNRLNQKFAMGVYPFFHKFGLSYLKLSMGFYLTNKFLNSKLSVHWSLPLYILSRRASRVTRLRWNIKNRFDGITTSALSAHIIFYLMCSCTYGCCPCVS
jgi:hypothetical protein